MMRICGITLAAAAMLATAMASGAETPVKGGTLNAIVEPEPATLMVGLSTQSGTQIVGDKIYEGLLSFDQDLQPRPELAESWTRSEDGLTYRFTLRPNVKWHDGKSFTAADVVFTLKDFLPQTSPRARSILGYVQSVTAVSDTVVELVLKQPFAPLLYGLDVFTAPMIPRHIYEGTEFRTNPANEKPVGTGPFKLAEWKRGAYIRLARNPDYWAAGKPYLDTIYFKVIPDAASRAIAFELGEADLFKSSDVEMAELKRLTALPGVEARSALIQRNNSIVMLALNNRKALLSDRRFRQALSYALDRNFVRDVIWGGFAKVATSPISSTSRFHEPSIPPYGYDPAKAKALLDEMGLKPDGKGTRATISLTTFPRTEYQRLAEYVTQQLAQIGVAVAPVQTDLAGWSQKVGNFDYDMTVIALDNLFDPAIGVSRNYVSSAITAGNPFGNISGYSDPKVDALFDAAAKGLSDEDRAKSYSEVQKQLVADAPVIWLVEPEFPAVYRDKVRNVVTSSIGIYGSFASTYLAGPR